MATFRISSRRWNISQYQRSFGTAHLGLKQRGVERGLRPKEGAKHPLLLQSSQHTNNRVDEECDLKQRGVERGLRPKEGAKHPLLLQSSQHTNRRVDEECGLKQRGVERGLHPKEGAKHPLLLQSSQHTNRARNTQTPHPLQSLFEQVLLPLFQRDGPL
jgi:hypothetical protein